MIVKYKETFKEDFKGYVESLVNKKMDSMEYDSYLKEEKIFKDMDREYQDLIKEWKSPVTTKTKKVASRNWVLRDTHSEKNEVCFTYDEGVMLIHYRISGEVFTKSKEDARQDWDYLVKTGFRPV